MLELHLDRCLDPRSNLVVSLHMSSPVSLRKAPRRRLTAQQAEIVAKLTDAAVDVLTTEGFDDGSPSGWWPSVPGLRRPPPTYFSSKGHLVAEVFWRRLADGSRAPIRSWRPMIGGWGAPGGVAGGRGEGQSAGGHGRNCRVPTPMRGNTCAGAGSADSSSPFPLRPSGPDPGNPGPVVDAGKCCTPVVSSTPAWVT